MGFLFHCFRPGFMQFGHVLNSLSSFLVIICSARHFPTSPNTFMFPIVSPQLWLALDNLLVDWIYSLVAQPSKIWIWLLFLPYCRLNHSLVFQNIDNLSTSAVWVCVYCWKSGLYNPLLSRVVECWSCFCCRMLDSVIGISLTCHSPVSLASVNWLCSLLWSLRKP
jgi:hypothetical protein